MNHGINIMLMFLLGVINLTSCAQNSLESEKGCDNAYNLNLLEVNNVKIFQNPKEVVISNLKLQDDSNSNEIRKYIKEKSFLLINDSSNEIVYFDLLDSSLVLTHPYLPLNTEESIVKNLFPLQYANKGVNPSHGLQTESVSLYNCKGDELRIYLYQNRVHSISYFIYENPEDWGNE
ncbi:MAG: hypothetical protein HS119_14505 [Flavobacteriales bacterium]|nr:hypothetical protein [Flavobacteriales bacterium]